MESTEYTKRQWANAALSALRLEVPASIADDVSAKVNACGGGK